MTHFEPRYSGRKLLGPGGRILTGLRECLTFLENGNGVECRKWRSAESIGREATGNGTKTTKKKGKLQHFRMRRGILYKGNKHREKNADSELKVYEVTINLQFWTEKKDSWGGQTHYLGSNAFSSHLACSFFTCF